MRVYVESTIPSYVAARPARDLLQAARQQTTCDWWNNRRQLHELFISQLVLEEVGRGHREVAEKRLQILNGIQLLDPTEAVKVLADQIIGTNILPVQAQPDAFHLAIATVHRMDILLSWNLRHITNAVVQLRLTRLLHHSEFALPIICSPEQFEDYE